MKNQLYNAHQYIIASLQGGFRMRRFVLMILSIFIMVSFIGCNGEEITLETPNTMPPTIMVEGELYFTTGEPIPIEVDESVIRTVTSVIKGSELPTKNSEINFPISDAKYAKIKDHEEYVVVLMDHEWIKFEKRDPFGLELTSTEVTPAGLTIVFIQSGGNPKGDLQTGSYYWLEKLNDDEWVPVEILPSAHNVGWTAEAYIINKEDATEWEVNWEWLYGKLPEGKYRIGKEVMDFQGTGVYDTLNYYADFKIVE
jgi:hypothetical protein